MRYISLMKPLFGSIFHVALAEYRVVWVLFNPLMERPGRRKKILPIPSSMTVLLIAMMWNRAPTLRRKPVAIGYLAVVLQQGL